VLPQILRLNLRGHIAAGEREGKGRKEAGRQERDGRDGRKTSRNKFLVLVLPVSDVHAGGLCVNMTREMIH